MMTRILALYNRLVLGHPLAVVLLILATLAGLALGLSNFKLDASADSLTLEHDVDLDYYRKTNQTYGTGDFLVVTYKPKDTDLFSDQSLTTLEELQNDLAAIEGVVDVKSILNVPLLYSPKITVSQLKEKSRTLLTPGVDSAMARDEFWHSPVYRDMILSPDGETTALLAFMQQDSKYTELVRHRDALRLKRDTEGLTEEESTELERVAKEFLDYRTEKEAISRDRVEKTRGLLQKYKDRAEIFLGGPSMITADMIDYIKSDLRIFGIGILIFIIATLAIIFRQLRWVVLPLLTCVTCVVMMLGYLSWIDWRLTVISSNFVSLLLIITLALTIHLVVRYRELHAANPEVEQIKLVSDTVSSMVRPCLYTVLTTIAAFASLVVSDIRPVIDFGWMMAMGISLALVLAFLMIPAGMMLLGKGRNTDKGDKSGAYTLILSRFTEHHGNWVWGISLIAAGLSIWGLSRLHVENRFIDYFKPKTEIYQSLSVIDARLGGTTPLDIILDAPETMTPVIVPNQSGENTASDDSYGMEDDPFAEPPSVESSTETGDDQGGKQDNRNSSGDNPYADDPFEEDPFADTGSSTGRKQENSYWFTNAGLKDVEKLHKYLESLPEIGKVSSVATAYWVANDLTGHRLNDFELTFMRQSLSESKADFLMRPYLSDKLNQTRISTRVKETDGKLNRNELLKQIRDYAVNEVGLKPEQVHLTGLLVLYNNMLQSLFRSQILTLGASFLAIMFMLLVLFRSLMISIVAILPNLLAAGIVLGGMGLAGIPLDMMTITIAAITVGIGVDNSIHYITRFRREFALDRDYLATMHRAHGSIGRALFYTAITIIVGFSILALSNFVPSVYFGLLTALAMFTALMVSLTLLPKLILLFKPLGK